MLSGNRAASSSPSTSKGSLARWSTILLLERPIRNIARGHALACRKRDPDEVPAINVPIHVGAVEHTRSQRPELSLDRSHQGGVPYLQGRSDLLADMSVQVSTAQNLPHNHGRHLAWGSARSSRSRLPQTIRKRWAALHPARPDAGPE